METEQGQVLSGLKLGSSFKKECTHSPGGGRGGWTCPGGPAREARHGGWQVWGAREVGQGGWQVWGVASGVGDRVAPGSTMQPPDEAAVFSVYDRAPWLAALLAQSLRRL